MLRFILLLGTLVVFIQTASSQVWLGVRGGVTTTDVTLEDFRILDGNGVENFALALEDARYGVQGGLMLQMQFGRFLVQPELLLHSNSAKYQIVDFANADTILFDEKYQYLDIPLLFGYRFKPVRLHAGPVGHLYLSSVTDLDDFEGYSEAFDKLTLGWQAGIGIDLWRLMIDLRYEGNFTDFGSHFRFFNRDYAFSNTPNRFLFTLGFRFGNVNKGK